MCLHGFIVCTNMLKEICINVFKDEKENIRGTDEIK